MNHADIIIEYIKELKKRSRYFKHPSIIKEIIKNCYKINSKNGNYEFIRNELIIKARDIPTNLKKKGYIKKYNTCSWEILNGDYKLNVFGLSRQKIKIFSFLKDKSFTSKELSNCTKISTRTIKINVDQINEKIPDFIFITREKNKLNKYSMNKELFEKYLDVLN